MAENYRREVGTEGKDWFHANGAESNDETYGLLYSYETLQSDDFCPEGWHMPSEIEFKKLLQSTITDGYPNGDACPLITSSDPGLCNNGTNALGFGAQFAGIYVPQEISGIDAEYIYFDSTEWLGGTDESHPVLKLNSYGGIFIEFIPASDPIAVSARCIKDYESCPAGHYGKHCEPCSCLNGTCDDGLTGSGHCIGECSAPWGGEDCDVCADETAYGPNCESSYGTLTDERDGETYKTVQIGDYMWMAENLRYAGEDVTYYHAGGNAENDAVYGLLYNGNVAMEVCPSGWHLPTKDEFQNLLDFVNSQLNESESAFLTLIAYSTAWKDFSRQGSNKFGFNALPAGLWNSRPNFLGATAVFWTSTQGSHTSNNLLLIDRGSVYLSAGNRQEYALSVRCVADHP